MKDKKDKITEVPENVAGLSMFKHFMDLRNEIIHESMHDIKSSDHRLEFVGELNGVEFINDSKATNLNLTWYSLERMTKPTIWIVGGVDTAHDYSTLKDIVKDKVKAIICLGKDNRKIFLTFLNDVDLMIAASSPEEAVKYAFSVSKPGYAVILSPSCGSYDQFENFQDRGTQYKQAVLELIKEVNSKKAVGEI